MNKTHLLIFLLFFLTACAPDPRKEAVAFETRTQAEQQALDEEQARQQQEALNQIALQNKQRQSELFEAVMEKAKVVFGLMVYWGGITATIVLIYVLVSAGRSLKTVIEGAGEAAARKAMVHANLIYIDKSTGQFPQLLEYLGNGKYSLTDLNDHSTMMLDTHNAPDRLAVRGAMAIRHALVMSNAASKSKDPTGVAMISPMVIDQDGE